MDSKEDYHESMPMLGDEETTSTRKVHDSFWLKYKVFCIIQVVLIALYTCVFIGALSVLRITETTSLTPISNIAIQYEPGLYGDFELSVYSGLPSPELDRAWHDLLANITIRVTESELKESNQTSVKLPNGGYMAWLGVSHELHCIKMLRQWNYREHYHPNITEQDAVHWDIHADHCLEVLRSAALCHADTTLTTFRWDEKEKPMLNTKLIPHKCVRSETLANSVRHRLVSTEEIGAMVNPLLHPNQ